MRKCTFRLDSGRATTGITRTVTITRIAITSRTIGGTTIGLIIGPAGIVITVITVTITTIGTRLTYKSRSSWLESDLGLVFSNASWIGREKRRDRYFFDLGDSTGFAAGPLVGWSIWNSFFSCLINAGSCCCRSPSICRRSVCSTFRRSWM